MPLHEDKYTPWSAAIVALLERMRAEHGSWRKVAALTVDVDGRAIRMRHLTRLRRGEVTAVSLTTVDKLCTGTGVGSIEEFVWFTADDMLALGLWKPGYVFEPRPLTPPPIASMNRQERAERRLRLKQARRRRRTEQARYEEEHRYDHFNYPPFV